jgi:hypothetical protein
VPAGGRPVAARFAARCAERLSGRPIDRTTGWVGAGGGVTGPDDDGTPPVAARLSSDDVEP